MNAGNRRGVVKSLFVGKPRNLSDKSLFHKVSLIAVLAWVGLGADGLSSSCYGPEETFKALGGHVALAPIIALACVATITVICISYSQIIELFPGGGGGYLVSSKLLSPAAGVVSGCALIVDYVLTIAISIASGGDAIFSIIPSHLLHLKLPFILAATMLLTVINLRGVKESVVLAAPVFFLFVLTHGFGIVYAIATHAGTLPQIISNTGADLSASHSQLGWLGIFALLMRAYSVGAGTYTGIEAVSNGLPVLREPRVTTGKRTMLYMGISLAVTVGGLLLAYLLYHVTPQEGKTLNAVLFQKMTVAWSPAFSSGFVLAAMFSAAALLIIAAQAGFLDGPRVLANMALDRWFPSHFSSLSDRFVAQNGILLMGFAAIIVLLATRGDVTLLVVLYSINVFITFSLSQLGMIRHWWNDHQTAPHWKKKLAINAVGFSLTAFILAMLTATKFQEGGWITLVLTAVLVATAFATRAHYRAVHQRLTRLDELLPAFQNSAPAAPPTAPDQNARTAVIFVNGFNGLGLHTIASVARMFPGIFKNYVFAQIGVVDAGNFKGQAEIENLRRHIHSDAGRYAAVMHGQGHFAETVTELSSDLIQCAQDLAGKITQRFPNAVFFGGQLVFEKETRLTRLLHNFTVFTLQRTFFRQGMSFVVIPIRV